MASRSTARKSGDNDPKKNERIEVEGLESFFTDDHRELLAKGLSLKEAVYFYGDNKNAIRERILDGQIPAIRLPEQEGGKWRIYPGGVPYPLRHLIPSPGTQIIRDEELDEKPPIRSNSGAKLNTKKPVAKVQNSDNKSEKADEQAKPEQEKSSATKGKHRKNAKLNKAIAKLESEIPQIAEEIKSESSKAEITASVSPEPVQAEKKAESSKENEQTIKSESPKSEPAANIFEMALSADLSDISQLASQFAVEAASVAEAEPSISLPVKKLSEHRAEEELPLPQDLDFSPQPAFILEGNIRDFGELPQVTAAQSNALADSSTIQQLKIDDPEIAQSVGELTELLMDFAESVAVISKSISDNTQLVTEGSQLVAGSAQLLAKIAMPNMSIANSLPAPSSIISDMRASGLVFETPQMELPRLTIETEKPALNTQPFPSPPSFLRSPSSAQNTTVTGTLPLGSMLEALLPTLSIPSAKTETERSEKIVSPEYSTQISMQTVSEASIKLDESFADENIQIWVSEDVALPMVPSIRRAIRAEAARNRAQLQESSQITKPVDSDDLPGKIEELEKLLRESNYKNNYLETRLTGLEDQLKYLTAANTPAKPWNTYTTIVLGMLAILALIVFRLFS